MCLWETCKMKGKGWGKYFWRCLNSWKAGLPRCLTRSWRNHLLIQSTQLLHSGLLFSYLNGPSRIFIAQVQYCRFSFLTVTFFSILFLIFFYIYQTNHKIGSGNPFLGRFWREHRLNGYCGTFAPYSLWKKDKLNFHRYMNFLLFSTWAVQ